MIIQYKGCWTSFRTYLNDAVNFQSNVYQLTILGFPCWEVFVFHSEATHGASAVRAQGTRIRCVLYVLHLEHVRFCWARCTRFLDPIGPIGCICMFITSREVKQSHCLGVDMMFFDPSVFVWFSLNDHLVGGLYWVRKTESTHAPSKIKYRIFWYLLLEFIMHIKLERLIHHLGLKNSSNRTLQPSCVPLILTTSWELGARVGALRLQVMMATCWKLCMTIDESCRESFKLEESHRFVSTCFSSVVDKIRIDSELTGSANSGAERSRAARNQEGEAVDWLWTAADIWMKCPPTFVLKHDVFGWKINMCWNDQAFFSDKFWWLIIFGKIIGTFYGWPLRAPRPTESNPWPIIRTRSVFFFFFFFGLSEAVGSSENDVGCLVLDM